MRVFVYFNLHKKVWSVRAMEGADKGRVILHATTVHLKDCEFRVSEAGRQRVLRERCKNVHAGVVGDWLPDAPLAVEFNRRITYDPYRFNSFVDANSEQKVTKAAFALLNGRSLHIPYSSS